MSSSENEYHNPKYANLRIDALVLNAASGNLHSRTYTVK